MWSTSSAFASSLVHVPHVSRDSSRMRLRKARKAPRVARMRLSRSVAPSTDRVVLRIPTLHGILHALQVLSHAFDAEWSVARFDRFENSEMVEMIALARTEDAE